MPPKASNRPRTLSGTAESGPLPPSLMVSQQFDVRKLNMSEPNTKKAVETKGVPWKKLLLLIVVAGLAIVGYLQFGDALSLESLAKQESQLRDFQQQHPVLVFAIAFTIYVAVTGLSLPGAAVLTLLYGWYFKFVPGLILVSFASTTGATLAFLLSRFLFRDFMLNRFGDRLTSFNQSLEREGPFFLFTLRLVPAVPFFVINAVMGLTPIKTRTFWWVSQLGMLAGTVVFVYAGASVPSLQRLADDGINAVFTPWQFTQIIIAFVLLGIFPLAVRWGLKLLPSRQTEDTKLTEHVK